MKFLAVEKEMPV